MAKIGERVSKIQSFITKDIWNVDTDSLSNGRKKSYGVLKVIIISVRGFIDNGCSVRASALTYFTLLSVVPIIALAFAIAKGFGLEEMVEGMLMRTFEGNQDLAQYLITFSDSMLESTKGGLIAGIGIVMLLYSVFKLLSNIEDAFNYMWNIKNGRPMLRKVTDYVTIMIFAPILVIIANSATFFLRSQLHDTLSEYLSPVAFVIIKTIPWVLMAVVFTVLYLIMPNTKVSVKSALISGCVTGVIFQLWQWIFVTFQVGAASYGAIYGSFAALPLFLMWVQTSWIIVLLGCEISYSVQNVNNYTTEHSVGNISAHHEKRVALYIMTKIISNFDKGEKPKDATAWSEEMKMSPKLFIYVAQRLQEVGLLAEIKDEKNGSPTYIPAMDINKVSISTVCDKLDHLGDDDEFEVSNDDKLFKLIDATYKSKEWAMHTALKDELIKGPELKL